MDIVVCGISHKTAPVEMLERLAFTPESHAGVLTQLTHCGNGNGNGNGNGSGPLAEEAVLLCTCNRVELYALMDDGATGAKKLAQFLAKYHQIPYSLMATHTYGHRGDAAVKHLFAVASGLDSMVLGEPQILGQVRAARETACAVGSAGHVLSTLFRRAIEAAKRVHTETAISQHAASVSYASVELATRELGDLSNRRVLIVGAGKTGQLTAGCLLGRGVTHVTVANRTLERAAELAGRWHGDAITLDGIPLALAGADIVIACTDSPDYLIGAAEVAEAVKGRGERPLLLIDISVPRNIAPEVGGIPGVRLCNMDDLKDLVALNLRDRKRARESAQTIVDHDAAKFMGWLQSLAVTPTIVNLRQLAENIRQQEMERAAHRLGGLSAHDLDIVHMLTHRIVNQLLHTPTVRLKEYASAGDRDAYIQALSDLFALDQPGAEE